ncbi:MAG: hypothetical protein V7784_08520 [Oceanospirillaceae bacterium]
MNLFEQINQHECIYLSNIGEPEENCLRLVIEEGSFSDNEKPMDPFMREVLGLPASDEANNCIYEIIFNNYICYAVLNESYAMTAQNKEHQAEILSLHAQSNYLDYVKQQNQIETAPSGNLIHCKLKCLNHIIDIVTFEKPNIKNIGSRTANNGISLL